MDSIELDFKIDAYSPETLPMKRLAQYIHQLADLYGNHDQVHFLRVDRGSAVLKTCVENTAVPKVRERVMATKNHDAPDDALRAWENLNDMLRKDNAKATLTEASGAAILVFPGREMPTPDFKGAIAKTASLDGRINGIFGTDATKHVHIEYGESKFSCECSQEIARQLKEFLYELQEVRLHGNARYIRNEDGHWELKKFKIASFETLDNSPLSHIVDKLRAIDGEWEKQKDPWEALIRLRHDGDGAQT